MRICLVVCTLLAILASVSLAGEPVSLRAAAEEAYSRWLVAGTAGLHEKALMEALPCPEASSGGSGLTNASDEPDPFGYHWVDNQGGDSVLYSWIELCGDSAAQFGPTGDDQWGLITWSFPFPFYGTTYASAYVSINGKVTFESGDGAWSNRCLTTDATQPTINVHWDDLVAQQVEDCGSGTPRIKYRDFGDHLVIEWNYVWHFPSLAERFTFEVILFASGLIKTQYASLECGSYCNTATVSIDVPGVNGIEYVCNGIPADNALLTGRAVCFYAVPPGPQELVIQPSGADALLYWHAVTDAAGYSVYRSTSPELEPAPENLVATVNDTIYTDTGILDTPEPIHFYLVTANR